MTQECNNCVNRIKKQNSGSIYAVLYLYCTLVLRTGRFASQNKASLSTPTATGLTNKTARSWKIKEIVLGFSYFASEKHIGLLDCLETQY